MKRPAKQTGLFSCMFLNFIQLNLVYNKHWGGTFNFKVRDIKSYISINKATFAHNILHESCGASHYNDY